MRESSIGVWDWKLNLALAWPSWFWPLADLGLKKNAYELMIDLKDRKDLNIVETTKDFVRPNGGS